MTGPLEGVKVLEVAEHGFVPAAAATLADWGADVVKVERPTGDPLRMVATSGLVADTGGVDFLWEQFNRNKRGVSLDLKNAESRPVIERLIGWADVFITNLLPDAQASLRLTRDDVRAVNPGVVYARGSGQGQRGPDAGAGGFDSVSFWSRGGVGHMLTPPSGPLVMQRAAMGDGPSGLFLAGAVAAALLQRERTGEGVDVDLSLLAGATWTLAPDLVATSIRGEDPPRHDTGRASPSPLIGSYRTSDGRWLMFSMMDPVRHWPPTCAALGLSELAEDPRYDTPEKRREQRDELHARFAEAIGAQPLSHWERALAEHDTIWSKMASPTDVLADVQVEANGYLPDHPTMSMRLVASPAQFDDQPVAIRRGGPTTGEHTDEVLGALGIGDDERARLRDAGAIR